MRVLVACEREGLVRDAFLARGADAVSCDLFPSSRPGPHIQGDALEAMRLPWDLVIAHPPCTFLSYAGKAYWDRPGREEARQAAMAFFLECYRANAPRVCVENPVGLPNTVFRKPDQIVQPHYFHDPHRKTTCLWLRGLLPLVHCENDELFSPATHVPAPEPIYIDKSGKRRHWTDAISGSRGGGRARSVSFPGIAEAMAAQWGQKLERGDGMARKGTDGNGLGLAH